MPAEAAWRPFALHAPSVYTTTWSHSRCSALRVASSRATGASVDSEEVLLAELSLRSRRFLKPELSELLAEPPRSLAVPLAAGNERLEELEERTLTCWPEFEGAMGRDHEFAALIASFILAVCELSGKVDELLSP